MAERQTKEDLRFDDDLDRLVGGERWPGETVTEGDEYAMELATARLLATHLAPLRRPSPDVGDRIWQLAQERIDAQAQDRLQPSSGIQPLMIVPRRRLIAVAAALLFMLSAVTPVGPQVVATAQEVMEAWGWIERAATPGDASTAIEVDGPSQPAGAPAVGVDAVTVPYDPNAREEIVPADGPAGEPAPE